ncbi:enoyl-CoA hydratase/isomerase family protein [Paraburkholderia nemoris]|uniref:2,3-dehydroadipyl-CoA hydratase n=1 Tax=Paraburkholderia nemoris TaxID=2793076 RepID=A0ABN7N051_9BURK|nr:MULTISPECIES: enoyl-CoA hydratase/isomerase family protein [Paraburkholderia]CAE6792200.1 2,3-dehydroadipyl-CoA hydratase [Paraburkholderia nemoris]CAE6836300.1 2,3-dehydroadipyl-CoA hydratase [Paraburkholderia nemoris]CAE6877002.1 2,3-dehydroadipyl-CoA hydratase [Paraburkholderia nemoris]
MSTNSSKVLFEMRGDVAVITLNDPDRRNALSRQIVSETFKALELSTAAAARAIVIASNGPTFCAGANIDDLKDGWMERTDPLTDPALLFRQLVEEPRIVIAAVQGGALGGGFELSLSCDLVVAAEAAWFALPEVSRGVIPNTGLALLQRMVGSRVALELILSGRRLTSDEGVSRGLVNAVVPHESVIEKAVSWAHEIVSKAPPGAISAAKRHLHGHAEYDWARVQQSVTDVPRAEWQEGLDAFTEKRDTNFEPFWRVSAPT